MQQFIEKYRDQISGVLTGVRDKNVKTRRVLFLFEIS